MIEHPAPFVLANGKRLDAEGLRYHSRHHVGVGGYDPSARIIGNYEAVRRSMPGRVGNDFLGWLFEVCLWDALAHYGIASDCITAHVQAAPGRKAEIDFVVSTGHGLVGIMVKTSLRERWAQLDRTGIIHEARRIDRDVEAIDLWGVFYREQAHHTARDAIQHAARQQRFFWSSVKLRSVLDVDAMRELFTACGATAEVGA
jgi:hypothetical protein